MVGQQYTRDLSCYNTSISHCRTYRYGQIFKWSMGWVTVKTSSRWFWVNTAQSQHPSVWEPRSNKDDWPILLVTNHIPYYRWFAQNIQAIMAVLGKIELEAIHISITSTDIIFVLVKSTMTCALGIFMRFDINFLENAWEFNCGVTWRNECFK